MDPIGETIKVVSLNVQGFRDKNKRIDVLNYLGKLNPDIISLQDTHLLESDCNVFLENWTGNVILHGKKTNSRGVAMLFNKHFEYSILNIAKDDNGNHLEVDIDLKAFTVKLITVYGPNSDDPSFYTEIEAKISETPQDYILMCGDLNIVLDMELDSYNYINTNNPKARDKFKQIIQNLDLIDVFRHFHPNSKKYTWRRRNPVKLSRLDYFIASSSLADLVHSVSIKHGYKTDHSLIEINLLLSKFNRGRGRWLFNTDLLKDTEYIQLINNTIYDQRVAYAVPVYNMTNFLNMDEFEVQYSINDDLLLEVIIMKLREVTISYSIKKKKQLNNQENILIKEINILESENEHKHIKQLSQKKMNCKS